jgi:DNA (cytosine-5)-methyltransferase 1
MNELALFAGAGGGILGGKLLGWRTVCAVEWEPYPASVLCARQNDKILAPFPIWDDVRTFDGKPWRGIVDVVSGGFPCQDISAAGHGAGISGSRSGLWSEMARIIGEVRPRYAFVENSPMLTSRGLGTVLGDLAALGFDARWGVVSAADVGAPHLRERIWIVAKFPDTNSDGFNSILQRQSGRKGETQCATVAPSNQRGSDNRQSLGNSRQITRNGDVVCGREAAEISDSNSDSQSIGTIHAKPICKPNIPNTDNGRRGRREISGDGGNGRFELYGKDEQVADSGYERVCQQGISNDVGEDDELPRGIQPNGLSVRGFKEGKDMADPNTQRLQGNAGSRGARTERESDGHSAECNWWQFEPNVGRVANGVAARVDRLKAIGNGQVPRVAATAFKLLAGEF